MTERRSLVDGLKSQTPPVDPQREQEFIRGAKGKASATTGDGAAAPINTRSPLSTRIRADIATALKRASLERQLKGIEPNTLCDILEEAIEPWLKANGYFP